MTDQSGNVDIVRRVTANLWCWQGLRWAAVGPLAAGAAVLATVASDVVIVWVGYAVVVVLAWWLHRIADDYYTRRYGVVKLALGHHRRRDRVTWLVVYPLMLASLVADLLAEPEVFLTGPVWAVAILLYRRSTGGGRQHYVAAAAALAALAPLPLLGLVDAGKPAVLVWLAITGVLYPVCGVLDHLELARRFPPVAGAEPAGAPR